MKSLEKHFFWNTCENARALENLCDYPRQPIKNDQCPYKHTFYMSIVENTTAPQNNVQLVQSIFDTNRMPSYQESMTFSSSRRCLLLM